MSHGDVRNEIIRQATNGCEDAHAAFYGDCPFTREQISAVVARSLVVEELWRAHLKWAGPHATEDGYPVDYFEKGDGT